jgi:hypothetical protein
LTTTPFMPWILRDITAETIQINAESALYIRHKPRRLENAKFGLKRIRLLCRNTDDGGGEKAESTNQFSILNDQET